MRVVTANGKGVIDVHFSGGYLVRQRGNIPGRMIAMLVYGEDGSAVHFSHQSAFIICENPDTTRTDFEVTLEEGRRLQAAEKEESEQYAAKLRAARAEARRTGAMTA